MNCANEFLQKHITLLVSGFQQFTSIDLDHLSNYYGQANKQPRSQCSKVSSDMTSQQTLGTRLVKG